MSGSSWIDKSDNNKSRTLSVNEMNKTVRTVARKENQILTKDRGIFIERERERKRWRGRERERDMLHSVTFSLATSRDLSPRV